MVTSSLPSRLATPREGILFSGLFLQTEAWGRAGKGGAALSGTPSPHLPPPLNPAGEDPGPGTKMAH